MLITALPSHITSETDWLYTAPLSQVYSYLTVREGKPSGKDIKFLCANHSDNDPSLFINDDKGVGHCFGCGWKFNRWQLLKEYGIPIPKVKPHASLIQYADRELQALESLNKAHDANKIRECIKNYEQRRLKGFKGNYIPFHCDHKLCPVCNRRHVNRFLWLHEQVSKCATELWSVTVVLPGKPLINAQDIYKEFKDYIDIPKRLIAQMRRKYKPFELLQNMLVIRQFKLTDRIAYLKLHLLIECTSKEIYLFDRYLNNRYRWSVIRGKRKYMNAGDALYWLRQKASKPLESWKTSQDLEIFLEVTKHIPTVYGLGKFRSRSKPPPERVLREANEILRTVTSGINTSTGVNYVPNRM